MHIALVHFGCIVLLMIPSAVELPVCINTHSWGCPISSKLCWMLTDLCALTYNAPSSTSATIIMSAFIICARLRIVLLLGGQWYIVC